MGEMSVIIANKLYIEEPSEAVLDYCASELQIENPEYIKKRRLGFWIGNTPRTISLYERDGNMVILPYGCLDAIKRISDEDTDFHSYFKTLRPVYFGGTEVPLYDYQKDAVDEMLKHDCGILQSPAGSGKTQMGIALAKALRRKTLWLTHTTDLLNQSKARAKQYIDSAEIGTITAGKVNIGSAITFATVQTMARLDLGQYRDTWDCIIVDECHRVSGTPTAVTQFSTVLNALCARKKYGLSATVHRSDGMIRAVFALLGEVIHTVPRESVADKVMTVSIRSVPTGFRSSTAYLNSDGTLNHTKLIGCLAEDGKRNRLIVKSILESGYTSGLILSDRLGHLATIRNALPPDVWKKSVIITGKMTSKRGKEERLDAMEGMRTGRYTLLFATYNLAKEGLDIPCLDRLFLTTPHRDYAVVTQAIGRIARVSDGKQDPIAYDFVDPIRFLERSYRARVNIYRRNQCRFII